LFRHGGIIVFTGAEHLTFEAIDRVVDKVGRILSDRVGGYRAARSAETVREPVAAEVVHSTLQSLTGAQLTHLLRYLRSPDLESLAHTLAVSRMTCRQTQRSDERLAAALREQLRLGLGHAVAGLRPEQLWTMTGAIHDMLVAAARPLLGGSDGQPGLLDLAAAGSLTTATIRNSELLARTLTLTTFHDYASALAPQVQKLHSTIRLPHAGLSRSVPFEDLYVMPRLRLLPGPGVPGGDLTPGALTEIGQRTVILGDPGAGKSTFAEKLTHDIAERHIRDRGQVPFLVILRHFVAEFERGRQPLADHLAAVSAQPYNVPPPAEGIDYLLLNGRGVVILDGLDELTEVSLRGRVVQAIEGFMHRYPLAPIVVTSRRIGYHEVPLDARHFREAQLCPFTCEEVAEYAGKWFALDESAPAAERRALATSFLRDTELVADLCANPLMLSMLCGMYAYERYIPRNRADVYEKCAVMLFDGWDRRRTIQARRFGVNLRGAVQYLAWQLLNRPDSDHSVTASELVAGLTGYFHDRTADAAAAREEAEQFLDFCTGRAWVLTDIGANRHEPRYSFTHRTFLEYFAADHLVRASDSEPARIFGQLRPRVDRAEWEEVSQLAVQLLDRNAGCGARQILARFLDFRDTDLPDVAPARVGFAARALRYVAPEAPTVRAIVDRAVTLATAPPLAQRFPNQFADLDAFTEQPELNRADAALSDLFTCLPENVPTVRREVAGALAERLAAGDETMLFLITFLDHFNTHERDSEWAKFAAELRDEHDDVLRAWARKEPWPLIRDPRSPHSARDVATAVRRFGPTALYRTLHVYRIHISIADWVILSLTNGVLTPPPYLAAEALLPVVGDSLLGQPAPWSAADDRIRSGTVRLSHIITASERLRDHHEARSGLLLLALPYLEAALGRPAGPGPVRPLFADVPPGCLLDRLVTARIRHGDPATLRALVDARLSDRHLAFLDQWTKHRISVLDWV
jgi:NACHT domain-containing protein